MSEPDTRPLPKERSASPAAWQAGCLVACAMALPPMLYFGPFAFIVLDGQLGWRVLTPLEPETEAVLRSVYYPLVWLVEYVLNEGWKAP